MPVLLLRAEEAGRPSARGDHKTTAAAHAATAAPASGPATVAGWPVGAASVLAAPPDAASRELYICPIYKTRNRGAETYVFAASLRTRAPPAKWVLAGVALVMDVACADDARL